MTMNTCATVAALRLPLCASYAAIMCCATISADCKSATCVSATRLPAGLSVTQRLLSLGLDPTPLVCRTLDPYVAGHRHGDKAGDMTLMPFSTYGEAAERLIQHNPLGLKRLAFVSSEDPDVVRAAQSLVTFGIPGCSLSHPAIRACVLLEAT